LIRNEKKERTGAGAIGDSDLVSCVNRSLENEGTKQNYKNLEHRPSPPCDSSCLIVCVNHLPRLYAKLLLRFPQNREIRHFLSCKLTIHLGDALSVLDEAPEAVLGKGPVVVKAFHEGVIKRGRGFFVEPIGAHEDRKRAVTIGSHVAVSFDSCPDDSFDLVRLLFDLLRVSNQTADGISKKIFRSRQHVEPHLDRLVIPRDRQGR